MRHQRGYRKLGRTSSHRRALLRNLVSSLFQSPSGGIQTTVEKAKEARPIAEKMITLGKREGVHARRLAARYLPDRTVVKKLFDQIAPKYSDRNGGYTRILRVGARQGDNADLALLQLVGIAEEARKQRTVAAADKDKGKAAETAETKDAAEAAKLEASRKRQEERRARRATAEARPQAKTRAKLPTKARTQGRKAGDS